MASNESRHKKEPKIHFLKLAFKDAKQMSQGKHSCLEEVKHTMNISLAPKFIGNLKLGLKEEMNKFLFVYQTKLNGVPLAYDRIQITKSKIIDDQEFLNLEICVNFIVFQPEISKILRGCVNKLGDHYYGCLFHNCINGMAFKPNPSKLPTEEIKNYFKNIKLGDEILIKISKIQTEHEVLFVKGGIWTDKRSRKLSRSETTEDSLGDPSVKSEMLEENNNDQSIIESLTTTTTTSPKKKKKKKLKDVDSDRETTGNHDQQTLTNGHHILPIKSEPLSESEYIASPKKQKKRKARDDSILTDIDGDVESSSSPSKKKKKKKRKIKTEEED
ncbi:DNA-directed RNA polymerase I subunit RPA43-like [Clytia hemisphaerica]|uniref:Uncharacterized protein n=1 Tax=Clytia hemisphaerica TaxID=252671 RepID=A0A7M6DN87_9CNID